MTLFKTLRAYCGAYNLLSMDALGNIQVKD